MQITFERLTCELWMWICEPFCKKIGLHPCGKNPFLREAWQSRSTKKSTEHNSTGDQVQCWNCTPHWDGHFALDVHSALGALGPPPAHSREGLRRPDQNRDKSLQRDAHRIDGNLGQIRCWNCTLHWNGPLAHNVWFQQHYFATFRIRIFKWCVHWSPYLILVNRTTLAQLNTLNLQTGLLSLLLTYHPSRQPPHPHLLYLHPTAQKTL